MISLISGIEKNDTNEHIYKIEMDSHTQKTDLWLPEEEGAGGGKTLKFGVTDTHDYL